MVQNKSMTKIPLPYRKQETDFYCGPAIVQMILASNGTEIPQGEIAASLGTSDATGTTIDAMRDFLHSCGFDVTRKNNASLEKIKNALDTDAMVVVGYVETSEDVPHYSLVKEVTANAIVLIDPWSGNEQTMTPNEFESRWRDDSALAYGERMMMTVSIPE
jgi:ABC-type bacteriocin/lantibiotic exporter with double-glycine peptidase domain